MKDDYLEKLIAEAAPQLAKITDPEAWLAEVRGYEPPRREVITIEAPRLDAYGRPIPDRFLFPVRVEVEGDVFYIGERFFLFLDIEDMLSIVRERTKCPDCDGLGFEQDKTGILKPCENCSE